MQASKEVRCSFHNSEALGEIPQHDIVKVTLSIALG